MRTEGTDAGPSHASAPQPQSSGAYPSSHASFRPPSATGVPHQTDIIQYPFDHYIHSSVVPGIFSSQLEILSKITPNQTRVILNDAGWHIQLLCSMLSSQPPQSDMEIAIHVLQFPCSHVQQQTVSVHVQYCCKTMHATYFCVEIMSIISSSVFDFLPYWQVS